MGSCAPITVSIHSRHPFHPPRPYIGPCSPHPPQAGASAGEVCPGGFIRAPAWRRRCLPEAASLSTFWISPDFFFLNVFAALSSFLLVMEMYVLMQKGEAFPRGEVPGRCRQEVFHFWTVNSWFRLRHLISPFYTRTHKETVEFAFGMGQGKWRTMPNFSCLIWSMLW